MTRRPKPSAAPRRVLVTGFDPFDGEAVNPSWEAVRMLDGLVLDGATLHARCLPCVFGRAIPALESAIAALEPELVVCVGQAGGRAEVSIERIAINIDDARIADNAGRAPIDTPVVAGAPAAMFSTLPIKAIVKALKAAHIPAAVSNTAGTFVCNHVFYGLMHALAGGPVRGGFIHVPLLPQQAAAFDGLPSLALDRIVEALRLAVLTSLRVERDIAESGGLTH